MSWILTERRTHLLKANIQRLYASSRHLQLSRTTGKAQQLATTAGESFVALNAIGEFSRAKVVCIWGITRRSCQDAIALDVFFYTQKQCLPSYPTLSSSLVRLRQLRRLLVSLSHALVITTKTLPFIHFAEH